MNSQTDSHQAPAPNAPLIGVSQIVIGVAALILATIATEFVLVVLGVVLCARGILDLYNSLRVEGKKPAGGIIVGSLSLLTGALVLLWPQVGSSVLSLFLAVLFIIGGGQKLLSPFLQQRQGNQVQLVIGLISVLLGVIILLLWPMRNVMVLGIFVGLEIMLNGMTITLTGRAVHSFGEQFKPGPQH
ncbi:MAG: DUF308 domain-containing protein [Chitinivibrionales bacterium]